MGLTSTETKILKECSRLKTVRRAYWEFSSVAGYDSEPSYRANSGLADKFYERKESLAEALEKAIQRKHPNAKIPAEIRAQKIVEYISDEINWGQNEVLEARFKLGY